MTVAISTLTPPRIVSKPGHVCSSEGGADTFMHCVTMDMYAPVRVGGADTFMHCYYTHATVARIWDCSV